MVHGLMHPSPVGDEPVVDPAQRRQHAAVDPGLLGDLADRGLLGRLTLLDMTFGQRPQHSAAPVDAADQRGDLLFTGPIDTVDDQPAGRRFVDSAQPLTAATRRTGTARFVHTGGCGAVDCPAVGVTLAGPGAAAAPAPPPAPTWLRFFAVGHPSDSSWRAKTHLAVLAAVRQPYGDCAPGVTQRPWAAVSSAGLCWIVRLLNGRGRPHRRRTRLIERAGSHPGRRSADRRSGCVEPARRPAARARRPVRRRGP